MRPWSSRARIAAGVLAALAFCAPASGNEVDGRSIAETARDSAKVAASSVWRGAQDLATFALGLIGVSYRFGGSTPEQGLDCSGLIRYVFQQVTGVTLPRTARELSGMGKKVALADLQPGDLVFFNTRRFAFSHVGIYLGDNQFVHAPHRGSEVMVTQMSGYWQRRFNGARRLVGVVPSLVPSIAAELVSSASAQAPSAQTPDDLAPDDAGPAESTQARIPADTPAQP